MAFFHTNPPQPPMPPPQNGPPGYWNYHRPPGYVGSNGPPAYWGNNKSRPPVPRYVGYENPDAALDSQKGGNGAKWLSLIQKVQKGLSVVETVGPLIQKYGPIVQNMPALLSMLKEMNQQGEDPLSEDNNELDKSETQKPPRPESKPAPKPTHPKSPEKPRKSRPKLYI